jgi:hypothetical protein
VTRLRQIELYSASLTFEEFQADQKTIDVVVRNIEIIGEAARNIPAADRGRMPDIAWNDAADVRNVDHPRLLCRRPGSCAGYLQSEATAPRYARPLQSHAKRASPTKNNANGTAWKLLPEPPPATPRSPPLLPPPPTASRR